MYVASGEAWDLEAGEAGEGAIGLEVVCVDRDVFCAPDVSPGGADVGGEVWDCETDEDRGWEGAGSEGG